MMKLAIVLFISLGFLQSCFAQDGNMYWVNKEYLDCSKTTLPCGCVDKVEFIAVGINKDNTKVVTYSKDLDDGRFDVIKSSNGNHHIYVNVNDPSPAFSFNVHGNELYLNYKEQVDTFVKHNIVSLKLTGFEVLGKLNVEMVEGLLNSTNFNLKAALNLDEAAYCHCNFELGGMNLVNTGEEEYILEEDRNSYYVYRWLNATEIKTVNPVFQKELIYSVRK